MVNSLKILSYAMEMERQGENFYLKYKDEIKDRKAKEVFESLAKIENEHFNILKKYYDSISNGESWDNLDAVLDGGEEIFQQIMDSENINDRVETNEVNLSDMSIMRMAYLIENDFAEFYEKALEKSTNPQERALLKTLAKWEHQHRELFYKQFKSSMENNWFDQNFYPF